MLFFCTHMHVCACVRYAENPFRWNCILKNKELQGPFQQNCKLQQRVVSLNVHPTICFEPGKKNHDHQLHKKDAVKKYFEVQII